MKSILLSSFLLLSAPVFAQVSTSKASVEVSVDPSVFETQRDELATFLDVVARYSLMTSLGMTTPCEMEDVIIGMSHGLSRFQTEAPSLRVAGPISFEIQNLAEQVHGVVQTAMNSDCAPAVNDKCCKKSNQADVSDSCDPKTGAYCKLTGIQIKGCTENSTDC